MLLKIEFSGAYHKVKLKSEIHSPGNFLLFQTNEVFNEIIHYGINVGLPAVDVGNISQTFHQRCSELATDGCSGILT